jgi:hypothetical protein
LPAGQVVVDIFWRSAISRGILRMLNFNAIPRRGVKSRIILNEHDTTVRRRLTSRADFDAYVLGSDHCSGSKAETANLKDRSGFADEGNWDLDLL